ncbi:uncharacterized protein LOC115383163 isoform X6 [Salarias fasciatus]|uniref:uncharacterized protein LOC115383163 isoform X6 n=1 Tax=Salarias fasciatus TaxID=181472 RepID=UPI001176691E|nr:zinc finger protein 883 isoform X6 [Salarias fasciatus]
MKRTLSERSSCRSQKRSYSMDQEELDYPQIKIEVEDSETLQIKVEHEDPETRDVEVDEEETEMPQVKEEDEEVDFLQVKEEEEELLIPQVKQEEEGLEIPQVEEEGERRFPLVKTEANDPGRPQIKDEEDIFACEDRRPLALKQETDDFLQMRQEISDYDAVHLDELEAAISETPKMKEKLIVAVTAHPELYDVNCPLYKDRKKKEQAWMNISQNIGMSIERCRTKWKSLRDTYARERKKIPRCGAAARTGKRWKHLGVLSFLDPFIAPRDTSGMEDWTSQSMESDEEEETAGPSHRGRERAEKRMREDEDSRHWEIQDLLLQTMRALRDLTAHPPTPAPPCSEDQLFLDSLAPSLERLDPQVKARVKFQIHKIIYDASRGAY